jgi:hypothetical protein
MKLAHYPHEVADDIFEAARVVDFVEERQSGRWRTVLFAVTEEEYNVKMLRLALKHQDEPERRARVLSRVVPPGDYASLQRRMTPQELREIYHDNFDMYPEDAPPELAVEKVLPEDRQWVPIMSDTPAEIVEHALALNNATGNVLITGLGLGCLPHALLSKPDVTRIDIIEIDPDVIELTGAYFIDPRVHIHQGSAADLSAVPADLRWDYAWHDIWSHISAKNLVDETAEHGISYDTLFDLWRPRVSGRQDAWAHDLAIDQLQIEAAEAQRERDFRERVMALPRDEWWKPLYEKVLRDRVAGASFPADEPLPDSVRKFIDPKGDLAVQVRERVNDPSFEAVMRGPVTDGLESEPVGNPNAHLEP